MSDGLCACGCGLATPIAKRTRRYLGHVKGQPVKYAVGHTRNCGGQPIAVNPSGLCMCGCGLPTRIDDQSSRKRGRGTPRRFVKGHHARTHGAPPEGYRKGGPDECWLWLLKKGRSGYGQSGNRMAHRVVYEALVGPIPDGLQLDHVCRNRACVNPAHLEPVTALENTRRSALAKLTPESAAQIRATAGTHAEVAVLFNVSRHTVYAVRRGLRW